jgi:hypothetical protein
MGQTANNVVVAAPEAVTSVNVQMVLMLDLDVLYCGTGDEQTVDHQCIYRIFW